jgi:hypothetical protein
VEIGTISLSFGIDGRKLQIYLDRGAIAGVADLFVEETRTWGTPSSRRGLQATGLLTLAMAPIHGAAGAARHGSQPHGFGAAVGLGLRVGKVSK